MARGDGLHYHPPIQQVGVIVEVRGDSMSHAGSRQGASCLVENMDHSRLRRCQGYPSDALRLETQAPGGSQKADRAVAAGVSTDPAAHV